jgi:hypothetical protein
MDIAVPTSDTSIVAGPRHCFRCFLVSDLKFLQLQASFRLYFGGEIRSESKKNIAFKLAGEVQISH